MKTSSLVKFIGLVAAVLLTSSPQALEDSNVSARIGFSASGPSPEDDLEAAPLRQTKALFAAPGPGVDQALGGSREPTVVVDPNNPMNVAYASLFQLRVSTDGGDNFQPAVAATVPATHGLCGDPSIAFDSQGRLFWTYLGCITDAMGNTTGIDIFIAQCSPTTGAILAGYPINVTASAGVNLPASGGNSHDKEWLAADFHAGSPFIDQLYLVWTDLTTNSLIRATFSANQGTTWSAPVTLSGAGEGFVWPSHNTVAPNGDVYAAYHSQPTFNASGDPNGTSGQVFVLRSTDGGTSYPQKTTPYPSGQADITFNVQSTNGAIPGTQFWLQGSTQPWVLADPNVPGRVYVVANDDPDNDHTMGDSADVFIAISTNNGLMWSAPTRIDSGPAGSFEVMPTAAIDNDTGCIAVHYYDNRNSNMNAAGNFLLDVFATRSSDGGVTFDPDFQINDTAFDPDPGAPCRYGPAMNCGNPDTVTTTRIGEYNGVAVGGGMAMAVWTGNRFDGSGNAIGQQIIFERFACNEADLSITKVDVPDPVITGQNLTYVVTVANNGPDPASGVIITDTLPIDVSFVSASPGCTHAAGTVSCDVGDLAVGDSVSMTITVNVDCAVADGTPLVNNASVSATTPDPDLSNNSTSATTTASNPPPEVACSITNPDLWPLDHILVNVGLSVVATDNCPNPAISVKVFGDEDDEVPTGDGKFSPDAKDIAPDTLRLRRESRGDADGRVYLIIVTATDSGGNVGSHCCTVVVPHDQSKKAIISVNQQAQAAEAFCQGAGTPPAGYVPIGDGAIIGPKQ